MQKRFITIKDVAADAQVSTATVSRVLNEPWQVVLSTRERVNASIAKMGYKPNLRARLLARGGSGTICFLLCNRPFIHSVHAEILQGAATEADAVGMQIVYSACSYSPDTPPSDIKMPHILAARGLIDGVIVAGTNYPNIIPALEQLGLPHVLFGTNLVTDEEAHAHDAVYVDDNEGGYTATLHLLGLGHTKIRFIGDISLPWYRRRYAGYMRAMTGAGVSVEKAEGSASEGELTMGFSVVNDLCDRNEAFTAVFAGGDMAALGAIRALQNRGIDIPGEVSVIGFNDEELAQIAEPPLTTIRVPKEDVGARCVQMLNQIIRSNAEHTDPVLLPISLVLRQSAGRAKE